jgi:hypothetical protein
MRGLLLGLIGLLALGCVTARGRADAAFERADYLEAAEQYGALVEETPGDASLRGRRDDARARALVALATRVWQLRVTARDETALAAFGDLLARRHAWPDPTDPAVERAIAREVTATSLRLRGEIQLVARDQPLAAERQLAKRRGQLAFSELDALWASLAGDVRSAGQATCRATAPADPDPAPYLARLTAAYCAHFEIPLEPAALPEIFGGASIEGVISGMTPEQRAHLDTILDGLLRRTPWVHAAAGAARRAPLTLAGTQAVAYSYVEVERRAPWSESVSYSEQESYQEPYQESYQETYQEPYTVQVPYTDYRTETYSCGFGSSYQTCTRSVSSTSYRTETQYRTAWRTAYRTAYRTAWRTVTRTRLEPRVFSYQAVERIGNYSGSWNLAIDLGTGTRLDVRVANTDRQVGYDHDASFPAAGVTPSRAHLPSFDDWFARLLEQLSATLPQRLTEHWATTFCQRPTFTSETAARCAYGGRVPEAARRELGRLFGKDVDRVIERFALAEALR